MKTHKFAPVRCMECQKLFLNVASFSDHVKTQHPDVPYVAFQDMRGPALAVDTDHD